MGCLYRSKKSLYATDWISDEAIEQFQYKICYIFLIIAQNIDCGYTLEPPRPRGGSNEYPQSMFFSKNKKTRYTTANPSFAILKLGSRG